MSEQPSGYLKEVLAQGETVLLIVRQHWILLLSKIIGAFILLIVILAAVTAVRLFLFDDQRIFYGYALVLLPITTLYWRYLVWRNHQYVITSRRVIQLTGVFNKDVIDSLLEKMNDVKMDQSWVGRIFGYGDLEILTASEAGKNDFYHISRPLEFKRAMLEAKETLDHGAQPVR